MMIENITKAIESAEVGYSLRLTRLVDGEHTYTLSYNDGTPSLTFGCIDDGYEHIAEKKRREMARAVVMALWNPDETMWDGLARDLVMWDRGMPNQYGSTLYKHLRSSGKPIPTWLLEEIPDIDHTPPKGTVAVCIFKAMLDSALGAALNCD